MPTKGEAAALFSAKHARDLLKVGYADSALDELNGALAVLDKEREGTEMKPQWANIYSDFIVWHDTEEDARSERCEGLLRTLEISIPAPKPAPEMTVEEAAREALRKLLAYVERNTCDHTETHRGGFLWEICDQCGKPEWQEPPEFEEARQAMVALSRVKLP